MVIDGAVRDLPELKALGFPIYAKNFVPNAGDPDREGKVGVTITINGVGINPGDFLACDGSGVVCVPKGEIREAINKAEAVVEKESAIRKQIAEGKRLTDILNF